MAGIEAKIERWVVKKAEENFGVVSIKLDSRVSTGWPDRLFLIPGGVPLFIEFKAPGLLPRAKQEYMHALLASQGYKVEVHDNGKDALDAIARALETARIPEKSC